MRSISNEVKLAAHIESLRCPGLSSAATATTAPDPGDTERLYDAACDPKDLWLVPSAGHEELSRVRHPHAGGFADTVTEHQDGILNYYGYPISTGPLEGTKLQLIKRKAYGYRDHEFSKLEILGVHETKYAIVG